jgi:hypothetical protein
MSNPRTGPRLRRFAYGLAFRLARRLALRQEPRQHAVTPVDPRPRCPVHLPPARLHPPHPQRRSLPCPAGPRVLSVTGAADGPLSGAGALDALLEKGGLER